MAEYNIDFRTTKPKRETRDLSFKGVSPEGVVLGINNKYFTKNNKPWYPVMGEFHFSRYPEEYWEESLLKMKAGGIQVVATYVFWIHHEEIQGEYDWSGQRNLRKFLELCKKCGLYLILRIGPWAHGECRNGGFPDWLIARNDLKVRDNNTRYFEYVKEFYEHIYEQVKGEFFKDGGSIVGIQLENEFGHAGGLRGKEGRKHIVTLKKIAKNIGFDVPFYTTTGWGGGIVVHDETIPVLGAYADAPWSKSLKELPKSEEFIFDNPKSDTNIATDLKLSEQAGFAYDLSMYPYLTAELGGGIQVTRHRRPIVDANDTEAMALVKLGSEANLLGYYMYHGGTNPDGKLSTLQESKATGYPNDLPELSYDFQAPIGEYGQLNDTFKNLKLIHMFLNDFGEEVAQTQTYIPEDTAREPEDTEKLRLAVRFNDDKGFVFLNNYQRKLDLEDKDNLCITVDLEDETIKFPPINLTNGMRRIMPYNMDLLGAKLKFTQAQPLCRLNYNQFVFFVQEGEKVTYMFDQSTVSNMDIKSVEENAVTSKSGSNFKMLEMDIADGEHIEIYTITRQEARNAWKVEIKGKDVLLITEADVIFNEKMIRFTSKTQKTKVLAMPAIDILGEGTQDEKYGFLSYELDFTENKSKVEYKEERLLEDGTRVYSIKVSPELNEDIEDLFLNIDFNGDRAKLYIDNRFVADWYYTGILWSVGLKRFKNIDSDLRLEIKPLHQKAPVYLEKEPKFDKGIACSINSIIVQAEYKKQISL